MLTQKRLKEVLEYMPSTGKFIRRECYHERYVGLEAGAIQNNGYVAIRIDNILYKGHRLAFLYMTGEWPMQHVNHINGIRHDNRWDNLEEVLVRKGPSGARGITWKPRDEVWAIEYYKDGKAHRIGQARSLIDAMAIQLAALRGHEWTRSQRNSIGRGKYNG